MRTEQQRFPNSLYAFSLAALLITSMFCLSAEGIDDTESGSKAAASNQKSVHNFSPATSAKNLDAIKWQLWSDDIFKQSQAQHKLVILDLHAVWCHWCHVMDKQTYTDPKVKKLIAEHFIAVSVDQDSRPDLANRYEDYGWPATIIYNPQGKELELLSGFMPPAELISKLQSCIKSPEKITTELTQKREKFTNASALSPSLKKELLKRFVSLYDTKNGGWTYGQKYLPRENVEYAMSLAFRGDKLEEKRAREVLRLQTNLLDPVWGGMYQYSTDDDWKHAHFEKIMEVQAGNMRIYSMAYLLWKDPEYLRVAKKIASYLNEFMKSPQSTFYTSQDADVVPGKHSGEYFQLKDQARRKKGIPRIDKHVYARENGWVIEALTNLYAASGDKKYLLAAEQSAKWILENRSQNGRFAHDDTKNPQTFLGDNLSMGRALLALYSATGDRSYLTQASRTADFISQTFKTTTTNKVQAGFVTTVPASAAGNAINLDENIAAARFFNLLYHYAARPADKESAAIAMRFIITPWVANARTGTVGGILLANHEESTAPAHIVIVGSKADALAQQLFACAQTYPLDYSQIEFSDRKEGKLPGSDIEYPQLPGAAAFLCSGNVCSAPVYSFEKLKALIARLGR